MSPPFSKHGGDAPPGFFEVEAAGLRWLAEARSAGGAAVVEVLGVSARAIEVTRVAETGPTTTAAERFGRELAATHRSGASHHGAGPAGWLGDGYIATLPLPHRAAPTRWGDFYGADRLTPYADLAARSGGLDRAGRRVVDSLVARLGSDDDLGAPGEPASRLHGDLWSGNVLWSAAGAVLVDPAAHGGHRETDLAMLALFGAPHLDRVLAAYDEAWPLAEGWRDRAALHQVHPLLVHAVLFGGSYGAQAVAAARRYL